mgnify:CR=1 FL=1
MKQCMGFLYLLLWSALIFAADDRLVVIGHSALAKTDVSTLQRLYTGRVVSINEQAAIPVHLPPGDPLRRQFLDLVMRQSEEQYSGYWLVRQYVGKGAPPQEFATVEALLKYVTTTPGAIGYLPASKVPMGANVIFKP